MNLFVTGGAGYIGSSFVEEALNHGHLVTVFDSLREGHRAAVDDRARFEPGDLGDPPRLLAAMRGAQPEAIVHFAAHALVGESMTNPGKYFLNNVGNGIHLLEAAVACRVAKFIFSSTCAVYGTPAREPMTEDLPLQPVNPYGESKRMFEKVLEWYQALHGLAFVAFRYFNAAGASARLGEHHRVETHLIPNILKVPLGQGDHCEIYGTDYPTPDGTCVRDYIHISDLAQAHLLALKPEAHGFFNLGNGAGYSVREVVRACEQVSGKKIPVIERPRRVGDPPRLVAAAEKAFRELGWRPRYPKLEVIVESAWRWHQAHPRGYAE